MSGLLTIKLYWLSKVFFLLAVQGSAVPQIFVVINIKQVIPSIEKYEKLVTGYM